MKLERLKMGSTSSRKHEMHILNMGSISTRKQEMTILVLRDQYLQEITKWESGQLQFKELKHVTVHFIFN